MKKMLTKVVSLILLLTVVVTTSCDNTEFREQIGEFKTAMGESRTAVESYYLEMNQFERELYLLQREIDKSLPAGVTYMSDANPEIPFEFQNTNLYVEGPFTRESIQARLDALKLIGQYGTRLAELAGTDAPSTFSDNTAALGSNVVNLSNTFRKLSKSEPSDLSAANYIQPISKLVGIVGQLYLENKRDKALVQSIRDASPIISVINHFLKNDLSAVIGPQKDTGLRKAVAMLLMNYNENRAALDRKGRRQLLDEVNATVRKYELFKDAEPASIVDQMEQTNKALLDYANSGRNKTSLARMVIQFGEFRDYAQKIAKNVQEIREIRRSLQNAN